MFHPWTQAFWGSGDLLLQYLVVTQSTLGMTLRFHLAINKLHSYLDVNIVNVQYLEKICIHESESTLRS